MYRFGSQIVKANSLINEINQLISFRSINKNKDFVQEVDVEYLFHFFMTLCNMNYRLADNMPIETNNPKELYKTIITNLFNNYHNVEVKIQLVFNLFFLVLRINIYHSKKASNEPNKMNKISELISKHLLNAYVQYISDQSKKIAMLSYFHSQFPQLRYSIIESIEIYSTTIPGEIISKKTGKKRTYQSIFKHRIALKGRKNERIYALMMEVQKYLAPKLIQDNVIDISEYDKYYWLLCNADISKY